jgi:hypothetical protein
MRATSMALCAFFLSAVSPSASAITFPSLTTIYVGAGVRDDGDIGNEGIATAFLCSNVSGQTADVRILILGNTGALVDQATFSPAHGATITVSTHVTTSFANELSIDSGVVAQGVVNIEATQSGVFCTAMIVDAADSGEMAPLHLVRVNPHPGTVE